MEPGPLPPHERTWRHPSEFGLTSAEVSRSAASSPSHAWMLAVASGVIAVAVITMIVVTTTPQSASQPEALEATTLPPFATTAPTLAVVPAVSTAPAASIAPSLLLASFTPIPNAIAAAPQFLGDEPEIADDLPATTDEVMVQTDEFTYHCTWDDVQWIDMPDGTVIVDTHGDLVAHVEAGELIALAP